MRTVAEEQAVRTFLQPLLAHREQSEPQLLPPAQRPVLLSSDECVVVADVEQRLAHRGAPGIHGESPHEELQQSFELRLYTSQQAWFEMLEASRELGPDELLQGIVQLKSVQLADPQDAM